MGALVQLQPSAPARAAAGPLDRRRFSRPGAVFAVGALAALGALFLVPQAMALIVAAAGFLALALARPFKAPRPSPAAALALGFLAYVGVSMALGGGERVDSAQIWRWAGAAAAAIGVWCFVHSGRLSRSADRDVAGRAVFAGAAALGVLVVLDVAGTHHLSRTLLELERFAVQPVMFRGRDLAVGCLLLSCGLAALLLRLGWRGWLGIGALALANLGLGWLYAHPTACIALLAALVGGAAAYWRPEGMLIASGQAGALWLVAAPWLQAPLGATLTGWLRTGLNDQALYAWVDRLRTWRFTTERIAEAPLLGHGFEAAQHFDEVSDLGGYLLPLVVQHPHALPLQVWLEFGAVGAALGAGALAAFSRRLGAEYGRNRRAAAGICALMVGALLCGALDVGLWAGWFWASLGIAASMIALSQAAE